MELEHRYINVVEAQPRSGECGVRDSFNRVNVTGVIVSEWWVWWHSLVGVTRVTVVAEELSRV